MKNSVLKTKHDIPAALVGPTQKHACYTMATGLDEKEGDMFRYKSLLKSSIDLIWVAWEVRG